MPLSHPVVVFTPDHLRADPPPDDALVIVVRFGRYSEEMADACAALRGMGREFTSVWVDHGSRVDCPPAVLRRAERDLAKAVAAALTRGEARFATVYQDRVEEVLLRGQAEVETVCEV